MNQMCQDLEIVGGKSVPQISLKKFIDMANAETNAAKEKGTKTKKDKKVLEKDILAIEITPSSSKNTFLLKNVLKEQDLNNSLRQSFEKICPESTNWLVNE